MGGLYYSKTHPWVPVAQRSSIPILCAEEGKLLWDNKLLPARNGIYISPIPLAIWAISNGSLSLLMTILGWFSRDNIASSDSLLDTAVKLRAHEILEAILLFFKKRGSIPTEKFGLAALIRAVKVADIKSTCSLLAFGVRPLTLYNTATGLAFGVRPLTLYNTATGQSSVLSLAIEKHSPDRQELLPIILKFIYDKGDIVEERDGMYNTALLTAVAVDNLYSVELLINSKFEVNHLPTRMTPRTPLQAACCCSSRAMVNFLLEKGANVNAPAFEFRGGTALQFAVIRGDSEIVEDLIRWRAEVNAPGATFCGRTAVEAAAEHGRVHILESCLLRPGSWDGEFGKRQYERARKLAEKNRQMTVMWILERSRRGRVRLLQPGEQGGVHPQLV